MDRYYLGVEIGGTKQQLAVCDASGRAVKMIQKRIDLRRGAPDILDWLASAIPQVIADNPGICAIGVGFGGPLESATGRVLISVQVEGWKDFELKTWFESRFHLPTTVVNDTVAGGYAELKLGAGRNSRIFFYSNIGTGIGGALYINGRTMDGTGCGAAYFGNTYTADWTVSRPGALTRIEALCSGPAIERRLRTAGYVPADSMLMRLCGDDISKIDCRMLSAALDAGDAFAHAELNRVAESYGCGVANAVTMLGLDCFAIGGGLANLGPVLAEAVARQADHYVFISGRGSYRVCICQLLDDNVPIGAALYARDGFNTL